MKRTEIKKLYRKAFSKWGMEAQLIMLMEECAELIQSTSKVLREYKTKTSCWRNFAEECADVEIMIDQMKTLITWQNLEQNINTWKHDKLLRLEKILEETN